MNFKTHSVCKFTKLFSNPANTHIIFYLGFSVMNNCPKICESYGS